MVCTVYKPVYSIHMVALRCVHVLIPGTCRCYFMAKRGFAVVIKDLEMGTLHWISWVGLEDSQECIQRKADYQSVVLSVEMEGKVGGDVTGSQTKECHSLQKLKEARKRFSSELPEGSSPAHTSILVP